MLKLKKRWDVFESRDLVRLLDISERELRYWAVLGIVTPELVQSVGRPGIRRKYSFKNVVQAGLVQTLLANHITLHAAPKFLRLVNKAWFFLYKPKQLFLVLHKGDLVQMYVRHAQNKAKRPIGTEKMVTDLSDSTEVSLGHHLERLVEGPPERDSLMVIAVHQVRDRLLKKLDKRLSEL